MKLARCTGQEFLGFSADLRNLRGFKAPFGAIRSARLKSCPDMSRGKRHLTKDPGAVVPQEFAVPTPIRYDGRRIIRGRGWS
jgi:hypothetical protein